MLLKSNINYLKQGSIELVKSFNIAKMTATTGIGLGVMTPNELVKSTTKKLDVAIAIKKFLVFGGNSDSLKCGKYFDFAFGEVLRIANRLKVIFGEEIALDFNEIANELTVTRGKQVFTITK